MSNMTPAQEAAAFHGMATNPAWPLADRLQMALQALEFHEADRELTQPVIEAAIAYREQVRRDVLEVAGGEISAEEYPPDLLSFLAAVDQFTHTEGRDV